MAPNKKHSKIDACSGTDTRIQQNKFAPDRAKYPAAFNLFLFDMIHKSRLLCPY